MTSLPEADNLTIRFHDVRAAARVRDVLLGVALDALQPYASDYMAAVDYRRLLAVVDDAVREASDAGLATLLKSLTRAIAAADQDLVVRLEGLGRRSSHHR